jgi:hypothetical protein
MLPEDLPRSEPLNLHALHFARSDGNGAFRIAGLGPGRYRIAAVSATQDLDSFSLLRDTIAAGAPVTVELGATVSVDLRVK